MQLLFRDFNIASETSYFRDPRFKPCYLRPHMLQDLIFVHVCSPSEYGITLMKSLKLLGNVVSYNIMFQQINNPTPNCLVYLICELVLVITFVYVYVIVVAIEFVEISYKAETFFTENIGSWCRKVPFLFLQLSCLLWEANSWVFTSVFFGWFRVNVTVGTHEERMMLSGMHTVADIFCCCCGQILGWKYVISLSLSYACTHLHTHANAVIILYLKHCNRVGLLLKQMVQLATLAFAFAKIMLLWQRPIILTILLNIYHSNVSYFPGGCTWKKPEG